MAQVERKLGDSQFSTEMMEIKELFRDLVFQSYKVEHIGFRKDE